MPLAFTLCADDYGMTEGVSRGILDLARMGRVSAASAMTSMPDWPRASQDWRTTAPTASLGLHLNLTLGTPLGPMPRFAPTGRFPTIGHLARRTDLPRDEIAAEFGLQIKAFTSSVGCAPTHVDGHQHVQVLRGIREPLFRALREAGLAGLPIRDSADRLYRLVRRPCMSKALSVAFLARGFASEAQAAEFRVNDGFAGFSNFDAAADAERVFCRYLTAPGSKHLVMCHPGHVDAALRALDPVTDARETEWRFLSSDRWPALLARANARLVAA